MGGGGVKWSIFSERLFNMIIDFHTHTFPDALAPRAVGGLASGADMMNYSDGTVAGLRASMARSGVDMSVVAPVVTRPQQTETINRAAFETNLTSGQTGVLSLGGIHPASENWREILDGLADNGFRGIKLHPLFQGLPIDDERNLRIVRYATHLGLIVLIHAGFDPSFPGQDLASPERLLRLLRAVPHDRVVLAHLGGMAQWDEAEELYGTDVYLDTACCLYPWRNRKGETTDFDGCTPLTRERFTSIVRRHGADRILFGSDSPWTDQAESMALLNSSGLTSAELTAILGANAAKLLTI